MGMFRFDASRFARINVGALIAVVAIIAAPADAAARHHKHMVHRHRTHASVQIAQMAAPQAAPTLGPMRYYGGPKSPMWREAR
jgi:uncharacterized membrane protein YccC